MAPTRIEIDRILCPVDFSEFSGPALQLAVRLGNWFGARVEVLHVLSVPSLAVPAGLGPAYVPSVGALEREEATQALADLVAPFTGAVPIETKVLEGDAWRVIQEEAEALPAGLLVIGTHGRSGFEHLLLGSVTEKVLRRSPCPVLTVGHEAVSAPSDPLFRRILCATALTQASEHTLDVALSLGAENQARITLLHVMETLPGDAGSGLYFSVPDALRSDLVVEARAQLRRAVPDAARSLCGVSERVESGSPWKGILRVAKEMDADLIVMGAHTGGAVGRMFFGSTASHVVRAARCPVLVIHETSHRRGSIQAPDAVAVATRR
jgi:nucleotide-binding universal stress UspA family protein